MYEQFRYDPEDFSDDVKKDILQFYRFVMENRSKSNMEGAMSDLYFSIKTAMKFGEIPPQQAKAMQAYFWTFV